jgi:mannose-1-phosphate guanylyltransferase
MNSTNGKNNPGVRCGIILAGGEGKRLWPLIHKLRGDALPKQYVNFIGRRSMLEHTYHRAEKLIPPDRLFTVVNEDHLRYPDVCRQLSVRPPETVVLQPENKETGPGLLLPLMRLAKRDPESLVAVFPSDHFILEEDLFMGYVDLACRVVERDPSRLVLLGVEPYGLEPEYGYILPGAEVKDSAFSGLHPVLWFIEKPGPNVARELVQRGGLWNTLVMAFKARTMLSLMCRAVPTLYSAFQRIGKALGTAREIDEVKEIYRDMKPLNLSRELLAVLPILAPVRLSVLPVRGVFWSDWGSEIRILNDLKKIGYTTRLRAINAVRTSEPYTQFGLQA